MTQSPTFPLSVSPTPISQSPNLTISSPTRVIVIGFDDWSMVDIQAKMPNLWAFMQKGAVDSTTHHSDLPTRSAPGFASIASGQYPDRHGIVNNSFIINQPRAGFAYWENLAKRNQPTFISNPPWVAFNRAGWDVGAVGWQGLALEERADASAYLGREVSSLELDQYWGIAIHRKDGKLQAGVAEIPELRAEFADGWKNGWAGPPRKSASVTLPMAKAMLQAGAQILFVYVENTHGRCGATAPSCQSDLANGTFDDLLQVDDAAFGKFFSDLEKLNITPANSLFVFTTDEQDHYLANYAQIIDTTDVQPSIAGSAGLFYGTDADAISATLAARKGVQFIATREVMKALHIATGADARSPTVIGFSDPDYTFNRGACSTCARWNHGTISPDIHSWLALVGPGIKRGAINAYSDHTDVLPTILAILNIAPAPDLDGVPIFSVLDRSTSDDLLQLREAFKQLNAPQGKFGMAILQVSTQGARAGTAARAAADVRIAQLGAKRDALISEMRPGLDGAKQLTHEQFLDLLARAQALMDEAGK